MLQKKSTREGVKHQDKISMDAFHCHGWLHVTVNDWESVAFVKISHRDDHIPYWSIDVPQDVVEFVRQNPKLTPGQLWDEILKLHPQPAFTCRVIYAMWAETNSMEWKRDPDELKSANILLEEFTFRPPTDIFHPALDCAISESWLGYDGFWSCCWSTRRLNCGNFGASTPATLGLFVPLNDWNDYDSASAYTFTYQHPRSSRARAPQHLSH
ncbi:hypothetical protein B0H13DRAFT_1630815 [Mycena leptocephala]|nr:hypothetical protein B0H13DRAFT_1630815 [Mycena leptocephala]